MRQKKITKKLLANLIKYAETNQNVLISGEHGIGKTHLINDVFNGLFGEQGVGWLYFSGATMDPWVDFIGIPKNYTAEDGEERFRIIRPDTFSEHTVQALYFDELNRADEKVLDAIMELLQFKSINGRKFKNLKCIWASINPYDEEDLTYNVTELDPAQKDRFQIQIELPYDINENYLEKTYGDIGVFMGKWWRDLSKDQKKDISPRRLTYAIDNHINKIGDVTDVLPNTIDASSFIAMANMVSTAHNLERTLNTEDEEKIKAYLNPNRIQTLLPFFDYKVDLFKRVLPYIPKDFLRSLLEKNYQNLIPVVESSGINNTLVKSGLTTTDMNYTDLLMNFNTLDKNALHKRYQFYRNARTSINVLLNNQPKNTNDYLSIFTERVLPLFQYDIDKNTEMAFCFIYHLNNIETKLQEKIFIHYKGLNLILRQQINHTDFITKVKDSSKLTRLYNFCNMSVQLAYFSQILNILNNNIEFNNTQLINFAKVVLTSTDFRNFMTHYNEDIQHLHSNMLNITQSDSAFKHINNIMKL
jgi:DNA polymerase III delta prime subunit